MTTPNLARTPGERSPREEFAEEEDGGGFVQRFVVVAALGALDAGGAARFAGAFLDGRQGGPPKLLQDLEPLLGDANPAGEGVVDEDLSPARIGVFGGGEATDVQSVAHGEEGQYADSGVLGGVQHGRKLFTVSNYVSKSVERLFGTKS